MATCKECGTELSWLRVNPGGLCDRCSHGAFEQTPEGEAIRRAEEVERELTAAAASITLTTESAPNLQIDRRIDIITAEVVIGMHLFKDIASTWRDVFGGRSKVMQSGLRDARKAALDELRREAASVGADAVIGVALNYSEISGGGKSMLFLVASGTAVTLRKEG